MSGEYHLGKLDIIYIAVMGSLYLYTIFANLVTYSAVIGVLLGAWFIWKPPEISIHGLKGIGKHLNISQYTAGTLSSLASNVPEAVIVGLAFYRSWVSGNLELMEIGLIMVLATIGMNLTLLGIVVIIGAKEGYVDIPKEALEYDMELYRFIFVAIFALFAYFVAHAFFLIGQGVQLSVKIPWYFSLILFISYPLYLWLSPKSASGIVESDLPFGKALIFFIFGNLGIFLGGELIVSNVEEILLHMRDQLAGFIDPIVFIALVLAILGAVPEHFVAVKAAARGEVDIALGNLLGGISQIILLILAGIGIFIEIPLDKYTLFQLILVALQFWFIKRSILDDQKLDSFEGAMILLFQVLAFVLLIAS